MTPQSLSANSISVMKQIKKCLPLTPIVYFHQSFMILVKEFKELKEITSF